MEAWKDIPGYEGLYEASTEGRIRRKEGCVTWNAYHGKRVWKEKILKIKSMKRHKTGKVNLYVDLWKDGKHKTMYVGRLVAMTWCNGYQEGLTVNHIDGDTTNNKPNNLEWISLKENVRHGFRTGLFSKLQKQCTLIDENGNETHFNSMSEASRSIGRSSTYIGNYILDNRQITSATGKKYGVVR